MNTKVGDEFIVQASYFWLCAITSESTQDLDSTYNVPFSSNLTKGNHARLNYRGGGKELSREPQEHLSL